MKRDCSQFLTHTQCIKREAAFRSFSFLISNYSYLRRYIFEHRNYYNDPALPCPSPLLLFIYGKETGA